jgi:hypothetical protein
VEEKKMATDALLEEMGVQRADAEVQQAAASVEAEKVGLSIHNTLTYTPNTYTARAEHLRFSDGMAVPACLLLAFLIPLVSLPLPWCPIGEQGVCRGV